MSNASIRRRIRQKKNEIKACERVIEKVTKEKGRMDDQISVWNRMQGHLNEEEASAQVVSRNQYEGNTAIKNHQHFFEA